MADIVFIVDDSASVGRSNFQLVRQFIYRTVEGLDVEISRVRVGVVLYGNKPKAEVYLDSFKSKAGLLQYIKILPYRGGSTFTGAALKFAKSNVFIKDRGSRRDRGVQQVAVVITAGKSADDVSAAAADLRRSGVTVFALGVQSANVNELNQIGTHPPRKFVFDVEDFVKLNVLDSILRKTLCHDIVRAPVLKQATTFLKEGCVETEEADFYFLIDHSGSIYPKDFKEMKKFILEFLLMFRIGPKQVRVGLVKFADDPTLEFTLTQHTDRASLEKAVDDVKQVGGGTEIGKALSFMSPLFKEAVKTRGTKVPEYLVVITDGKSSDLVKAPAEQLRKQGIIIYAIGVKDADQDELVDICGDTKRRFFVSDFDALKPIKNDIVTDICTKEACKDMLADVVFLIDSSGRIDPQDFTKMKTFVRSMVAHSLIGEHAVRISVLQFSTKPQEEFALNTYYTKDEMDRKIDLMQQLGGGTQTGSALTFSSQYFDVSRGGRPNVPQILVLITDGEAQDKVATPALEIRNRGVTIYSIGVDNANVTQLMEISGTQDRIFLERDFDGLKFIENKLLFKICHPETACKRAEVADMMFLVDGSSSIDPSQFRIMQRFMISIVNSTIVGEKLVRFGAIVYSNRPESKFTLDQYTTNKEVRQAISDLQHPGGDTYTAEALEYSLAYFGAAHGGRGAEHVPQILFVITDGEATDSEKLPEASQRLLNSGISVYGIGVAAAPEKELLIMTGDQRKVFHVENYQALEGLYKNISQELCNETKADCEKRQADLVMLIDGSESISAQNFEIMKQFMNDLVGSFTISHQLVQVGVAQFSSNPQKEFFLNEYGSEAEVKRRIYDVRQMREGTFIGKALNYVRIFFEAANGSRKQQGVSQNLVVITDGESQDDVLAAAEMLRAMKIEIFVIGIGKIKPLELIEIAGAKERFFTVRDFSSLDKIKSTVVETICDVPQDQPGCTVDIAIGFDVTRRPNKPSLFSGQQNLQTYLPEIIRYISSLDNLCCSSTASLKTNIGFRLVGQDGRVLDDFSFEKYNVDVVTKILGLQTNQDTFFNTQLLRSFQEKFTTSSSKVKILIIFSDGLDGPVEQLEIESDRLRNSGVSALLTVALEGVHNANELQMIEFGRGFGYNQPLDIRMQNIATAILAQTDMAVERDCCGVMCKCTGQEGARGLRGPPGTKGLPGPKGHPGFPGEEGGAGDRGPPGANGIQGLQGCPGRSGLKGGRGYRGDVGDDGEHGLDGVDGEQGATGVPGTVGEKGDPGNPGRQGIRGDAGVKGQRGLRGDPGESGKDNTNTGPRGERGGQGPVGDMGPDGEPGGPGSPGNLGPHGRRGAPGDKGARGDPGDLGYLGSPGPNGPQGGRGPIGQPGPIGSLGLQGPQGPPGPPGPKGSRGSQGEKGQKGQSGDPGIKGSIGSLGPRGMPGQDGRDGYGFPGSKGIKGETGFPGYPGLQGEDGVKGSGGGRGAKGNHGRGGNAGNPGQQGDRGSPGPNGHRGQRGPPGSTTMSGCQLISYVRDNCACAIGRTECPAYPTELVLALDTSQDVTPQVFERMRSRVVDLLEDISIAESNCPTGARVAVVSYSSNTKYLIRFSDYHQKKHLLEAVNNLSLERSSSPRNIGAAMRFVARNVFKRTRQALLMRKVAIFFANGPSQDATSINTAVLEFKALDIHPAVIGFRNTPNVRRAFETDETRSFIVTTLESGREPKEQLKRIQQCIICYDPCRPAERCAGIYMVPEPLQLDMDLAVVVDGSRNVQAEQYDGVKELLGSVLEQVVVSNQPKKSDNQARVALYQQISTHDLVHGQSPVKKEYGFLAYEDHSQMKSHILSMKQAGGTSELGHAVEWVIMKDLLTTPKPRKNRMVLAVVGGETSYTDRAKLHFISNMAKCQGIVLFTLTTGNSFNNTQVTELASFPLEQHIVHLGDVKKGEQEYGQRFLRAFLSILKRGINAYPSPSLRLNCQDFQTQTGQQFDVDLDGVFEAAERPIERVPLPTSQYDEQIELEYTIEEEEEDTEQTNLGQTDHTGLMLEEPTVGRGDNNAPSVLQITQDTPKNDDVCLLRQNQGSCQSFTVKWYYDIKQNECLRFWYGGCNGSGNRFDTKEDCEARCVRTP